MASFDDLLLPLSMLLYCLNTYCPKDGYFCVPAFEWAMRIVKSNLLLLAFLDQNFIGTNFGVVISRLFGNYIERAVG